jgi:hypothetical protein
MALASQIAYIGVALQVVDKHKNGLAAHAGSVHDMSCQQPGILQCTRLTSAQCKLCVPGHCITLVQDDQLELVAAETGARQVDDERPGSCLADRVRTLVQVCWDVELCKLCPGTCT